MTYPYPTDRDVSQTYLDLHSRLPPYNPRDFEDIIAETDSGVEMVQPSTGSPNSRDTATGQPTWNGDEDPDNPQSWSIKRKWAITLLISAFTFNTMMTSTLIAPALTTIAEELHVTHEATTQLMLSSYTLAYCIGSFLWAPMSELFGRVAIIQVASTWFFIWNMVCGFASSGGLLIAARLLSGMGGSVALAVSSGVLSDCWRPAERGRSLAVYTFIPLLGPAVGPILGGVMTQYSTWRWAFWSTSIFDVFLQLLAVVFLHETHHTTIIHRKTRGRSHNPGRDTYTEIRDAMMSALRRPFQLLASQSVIIMLGAFSGISFGIVYIFLSLLPRLFVEQYHQTISVAGLNYISFGTGFIFGAQALACTADRVYRRRALTSTPEPEMRLKLLLPSIVITCLGLLCIGWPATRRVHWIIPNIGVVVFAAGIQYSNQCVNAYIIDVYGPLGWSASAMAGIWALKSIASFCFPLFAPGMVNVFGWGWSCSMLASFIFAVGLPVSIILHYFGDMFRETGKKRLQA